MTMSCLSRAYAAALALVMFWSMGVAVLAADDNPIERYLTDDVGSVAFVNLAAVDAPAAFAELQRLLGEVPGLTAEQATARAAHVQKWVDQMQANGASRIYALGQASAIVHVGPVWVLPLGEGANAQHVLGLMLSGEPDQVTRTRGNHSEILPNVGQVVDGAVVCAMSDKQLEAYLDMPRGLNRPEAAEALAALSDADAGVIAFGDPDSRRVVREMFPQLPAPFSEIDGKLLADGVRWFGVAVKLPPELTISVTIEAGTPEAAKTLEQAAEKGVATLKGLCMAAVVKGEAEAAVALPMLALLKPKLDGLRLSLTLRDDPEEIAAFRNALAPAVMASREAAQRAQRMNNFKQIALGMLLYDGNKRTFPPAASYDANGGPLLSWRVLILPYIEQEDLYNQFHLDEPWDSEHNRTLIPKMPAIFSDPGLPDLAAAGRTTFLLPVGEGTVFEGREGRKLREITDGTSATIMAVEVIPELAVVWTKPDDWEVDLADPLRGVKRRADEKRGGVFTAAWCDGSVRVISGNIDPTAFKGLLTRAGGEPSPPQ